MESNIKAFHESITNELQAVRNRIRSLIGDKNWGEEGRYKEGILRDVLRRHLPQQFDIGTGFVFGVGGKVTKQIDIIIYDKEYPVLFRQEGFMVITADGVRGIVEVKTSVTKSKLEKAVTTASSNGGIILASTNDRTFKFFNGLFVYDIGALAYNDALDAVHEGIKLADLTTLDSNFCLDDQDKASVNHLCFGTDLFMKRWLNPPPCILKAYNLKDLAIPYFIFNLMDYLQPDYSREAGKVFFPLDSKEVMILGDKACR